MPRLVALIDSAVRYLLPVATISALVAAAAFVSPLLLDARDPDPEPSIAAALEEDGDPGVEQPEPTAALEPALVETLPTEPPRAEPTPTAIPTATPRPVPPRASAELPIIMYHHVGNLPPNADAIRRDLTVSPDLFERELQYLEAHGIATVSLDDLLAHLAGRSTLPGRAVVLTFDDGYDDNYEFAFPILKKYGMVGTFFVATGFVERPGYMTWQQLKEMSEQGMSIQAHSIDHADLTVVNAAMLTRQLAEPKRALEEALGRPVRFVAYPSGKYNRAVIQATAAAGYAAAVTVKHGTRQLAESPFEFFRVRARGSDTVEALAARMTPPSWQATARP